MLASAIIAGGGVGERFGGEVPKQFHTVGGRMIIELSLAAFASASSIESVVVVVPPFTPESIIDTIFSYKKVTAVVPGGKTRQQSILSGLGALKEKPEVIVVHDAARPLVEVALIDTLVHTAKDRGAAIPVISVIDSLKYSEDGITVTETVPRKNFFRAQTPQAFRSDLLIESIRRAEQDGISCTDDAQMVERLGHDVSIVKGSEHNIKLTSQTDLLVIKSLLGAYTGDFTVGVGYDAHRLVKGRELHLGGIHIEWEYGLLGHSDGDCALHAIADALLGASGLGDIGFHFPPDDDSIRGISSVDICAEVKRMVDEKGFRIVNVDCVIICQQPRITDYGEKMIESISAVLGTDRSAVSVKGKTTEGMGFEGSGEGISSIAVVLLERNKGEE